MVINFQLKISESNNFLSPTVDKMLSKLTAIACPEELERLPESPAITVF